MKSIRKFLAVFLLVALVATSVNVTVFPAFAKSKTVKTKSIKLNKNGTITMTVGDKLTLKATVKPKKSTQKVKWSSSDKSVATVSKGVVKAKKAGKTTITATSGKKKAKVTVEVVEKTPEATEKPKATEAPAEKATKAPKVTEAPTEKATKAPAEKATEVPAKATEVPTEKATKAPKATEAPAEKATEAPKATVPDVTGMKVREAKSVLAEALLMAETDGQSDLVAAQAPAPGAEMTAGGKVMLYTYAEEPLNAFDLATVPNVKGLSMVEAARQLRARGFDMEIRGSGLAASQSPAAGTYAPLGTVIRVTFELPLRGTE